MTLGMKAKECPKCKGIMYAVHCQQKPDGKRINYRLGRVYCAKCDKIYRVETTIKEE